MHRELSNVDDVFERPRTTGLYALTAILLALVVRDVWPDVAGWLNSFGIDLPIYSPKILGVRYALIAAVIGGARVLYSSLERLFERQIGADLALAIACIAAILIGEPLVAAEVVLIGLIGECLEAYTFGRTQNAIRKLAELFPLRCWLVRDGQEVRVLVRDVQVGDRVVVKPGAKVPVDGTVEAGSSAVDVSALTGESLPVDKNPGDDVLAGSINQNGALTIEARRVREHTVAGRMVELTARAIKDKSPIERQADRWARWFLPIVLALTAATYLGNIAWYAGPFRPEAMRVGVSAAVRISVYPALAVLVVACPCALILATPAAVIAALGRLAGTGVLLKSGAALERLAGITSLAFDKTGTLTEGKVELGDVIVLESGFSPNEVLRLAASAEQPSEHPLAQALLAGARERGLTLDPLTEFSALPGAGVTGVASGRTIAVGAARHLEGLGIALPQSAMEALGKLDSDGQTALLVAVDGKPIGAVGARDRLRPSAIGAINELRMLGVTRISLLTGDRLPVARRVAHELGIEEVHAELMPAQKADHVGQDTAYVGDGVNDAPALARSLVGLAVGSGTDIAAEAGDVVLMGDPLRPLPLLLRLSRRTVEIIRQNIIVFALGVNLAGIAITGWLWPLFSKSPNWIERAPLAGVIYHQIGSLLVLLNSMRLLAFERRSTSAVAQRLRNLVQFTDGWIDRLTNVDELLHDLGHRWKPIAGILAVTALAAWLLSGITIVGPDEVAVVRRFGRVLDTDAAPGFHWQAPYPIDAVTRLKPRTVQSISLGFRVVREPRTGSPDRPVATSWMSQHEGEGVLRIIEESQIPTGDGNLVEMLALLTYRVSSPRQFVLSAKEPEALLRSHLEAVLRETAAAEAFLDLLTQRRDGFQRDAYERLQRRLQGLNLGVALEGLSLRDLHPPPQVVPAFHAVAQAAEDHDRRIKDAEATALRTRRSAESDALETERQAQAQAARTRHAAEVERDAFLAWHRVRSELSPAEEARILAETIGSMAGGYDMLTVMAEFARRRNERLALQAFLTDFRLTWNTLAQTLSQRDKVLIDSDKLPGRRTLMLFGPDQLTPPPIIVPNRPLREPRGEEDK